MKSLHGCTSPSCLAREHQMPKSAEEEINATMRFFNIKHSKAIALLMDLRIVYKKHGLNWNATSEAIKKL